MKLKAFLDFIFHTILILITLLLGIMSTYVVMQNKADISYIQGFKDGQEIMKEPPVIYFKEERYKI